MRTGEREIEAAEAAVEAERLAGIAALRSALTVQGEEECIDCGEQIEAQRRRALPSARRCIDCQHLHERKALRGY